MSKMISTEKRMSEIKCVWGFENSQKVHDNQFISAKVVTQYY